MREIDAIDVGGDALVPLAEMLGYATDLRARTRGRGTFTMQLAGYQPANPPENGGTEASIVGAPRKPTSPLRALGIALPEPMDDDLRPI